MDTLKSWSMNADSAKLCANDTGNVIYISIENGPSIRIEKGIALEMANFIIERSKYELVWQKKVK